jgi:hypothetical protein
MEDFRMTWAPNALTTVRIIRFISLNIVGGFFLWWLVLDDPRRKPALLVLIPCMLLIDVVFIKRMFRNRMGPTISLPIVYVCGFAYGIWWLAQDFMWWKVPMLAFPLLLLTVSLLRLRKKEGVGSE